MRHQGVGTACIHRRSSTGRRLLQWSTRRWMFLGDGLTDTWWSPSNLMMKCSSHIEKRKRKKMIDNDQKQNIAEIFLLWFFRISRVRIWKKERNKSCLGGKSRESMFNQKNLWIDKEVGRNHSALLENKLGYDIALQNKLKQEDNNPRLTDPNNVVWLNQNKQPSLNNRDLLTEW